MTHQAGIPTTPLPGRVPVAERLRAFNETLAFAVLATNENGKPYTSLIAFAVTSDLKDVVFATPKATRKYQNILSTKHVALLIDNRAGASRKLMATEAITILGKARQVLRGASRKRLLETFLKKHPDLEDFARSDSTALMAVRVARCIHVGQFQTVSVWKTAGWIREAPAPVTAK